MTRASINLSELKATPGHKLEMTPGQDHNQSWSYFKVECTCNNFAAYSSFKKDGRPGSRLVRLWEGHLALEAVPDDFVLVIGRIITDRTVQTIKILTSHHPDVEALRYRPARSWAIVKEVKGKGPKSKKKPYTNFIAFEVTQESAIHRAHEYMLGSGERQTVEYDVAPGTVELVHVNDLQQGCLDLLAQADEIVKGNNVKEAMDWRRKTDETVNYLELLKLKNRTIEEYIRNVTKGTS